MVMTAKSPIFPLITAACIGGASAFILAQLQFELWTQPTSTSPPVIDTRPVSPTPAASPAPSPSSVSQANGLRVSNRSASPVRVVLMPVTADHTAPTVSDKTRFHWDFSPQEGSQGGLLLSLPQSEVRLSPGDVLVAFALDGTRRYWGPYIVGETPLPQQSAQNREWQLVLRP